MRWIEGGAMYRKILIPTDGSPVSMEAALAGVAFARWISAQIIAVFVAPDYRYPHQYPLSIEMIPPDYPNEEEYISRLRQAGDTYLAGIRKAAEDAGLKFSGITVFGDSAAHEIIKAAQQNDCDLIFMGSHGRTGWRQLLLGSVTAKVLALSDIPVLVHPPKRDSHGVL